MADGVYDPAQDELSGGPTSVPLEELLERYGLVSLRVRGIGSIEDLVHCVEQVSSEHAQTEFPTLSDLDEVIDEHVRDSNGSLERPVGRTDLFYVIIGDSCRRQSLQRERGGVIFVTPRQSFPRQVVQVFSLRFESVVFTRPGRGSETFVRQISYGLGHDAEGGGRLCPPHRAGQWYGEELFFPFVRGQDDGQAGALAGVQVHPVESVLDVVLREKGRSELRVGVAREVEHPGKRAAKLHGLRWCVRKSGIVDWVP